MNEALGPIAGSFLPGMAADLIKKQTNNYNNFMAKVFSHDVRQYFNINNEFVIRKIKQVVFPFWNSESVQQIRKAQLYIPIVGLMTFIMFSAFSQGFLRIQTGVQFQPKIQRRIVICLLLTLIEVAISKFTRVSMSSIDMGFLDMMAFISYRYVGLSIYTIILTIVEILDMRFIAYLFLAYFVLSQAYFYYLQLKNYMKQRLTMEQHFENPTLALIHLGISVALVFLCYFS